MQKKVLLVFTLFALLLYIVYGLFYKKTIHTIKENNISIKKITTTNKASIGNISSPKILDKLQKNDIEKNRKKIETIALENYYDISPIAKTDVVAGNAIKVYNFYDSNKEPSWFVPLYSNLEVTSILIFRQYNKDKKKELGVLMNTTETWYHYPPSKQIDAEILIKDKYPNIIFNHIQGYYYINKGKTPYYLFKGNNNEDEVKYYLVSAHDKSILVKSTRTQKIKQEIIPVSIDNNGYMTLKESAISELNLSNSEQEQLKDDIKITNEYIKQGLMKFDKNLNIIFDKYTTPNCQDKKI